MRLISWNMGCAYGQKYVLSNTRAWQQLMAWEPDFALLQEAMLPESLVASENFAFAPSAHNPRIGTLVYAKAPGATTMSVSQRIDERLPGQVAAVEVPIAGEAWVLASIHARAASLDMPRDELGPIDEWLADSDKLVWPIDVILHDLRRVTKGRRFVVGGDLNASIRFDDLSAQGRNLNSNSAWFTKARAAGWCNAHRKFNAGDQRTLFRHAGKDDNYQIDHVFTDSSTWYAVTRCEVMAGPFLEELSDHAPLVLEVAAG